MTIRPLPLLSLLMLPAAALAQAAPQALPEPQYTARILEVAPDAFAGNSVNTPNNQRSSLITQDSTQFAAWYRSDGQLMLGRRELGSDQWEVKATQFKAKMGDAHNTVALGIDSEGRLHVAWDHHGAKLNYTRSVAPGSIELGERMPMNGEMEGSVTYPAFIQARDGRLLFFYRDGESGKGNFVLKRFDAASSEWTTVHSELISGEGQRNAYPSVMIDRQGVIHMAWTWRETPDVASNHDICYARSEDGGKTWRNSAREVQELPITAANAEYVARIPQGSSLMNPPAVAGSAMTRPYIVGLWAADGSDIPQLHLLTSDMQGGWTRSQVTQRTTPFSLAGGGTRRVPISRAEVMIDTNWSEPDSVFVVYRDDECGGRAVLASCQPGISQWRYHDLTDGSLGAWEPSIDYVQWHRMPQLHTLVQPVEQRDGDDSAMKTSKASSIGSLIWSPDRADWVDHKAHDQPDVRRMDAAVQPAAVLDVMRRSADWQLQAESRVGPTSWIRAPFFMGVVELAKISGDERYWDAMVEVGEGNEWRAGRRDYHADDHCVVQLYGELWKRYGDPKMIEPSVRTLFRVMHYPSNATLDWDDYGHSTSRWSWCDALFMAPASFLVAYEASGDKRFLDFMDQEWWATTDYLYNEKDQLYFRDGSYFDLREPNGENIYWSRGNGWVAGGICRVLDRLPEDHPNRARYEQLYKDLMEAIIAAQQDDGLWRTGLKDSSGHPEVETSGSSFFTYALAWGINRGYLDRAEVEPAVRRAWNVLTACVNSEGKLEHVQPVGAAPAGFDPHHSEPYGVGAFLLAGSEVFRLYGGKTAE